MNYRRFAHLTRQLIAVTAFSGAALTGMNAHADSKPHPLPRVVVEGQAQLREVCPSAEAALQDHLEAAVSRYREAGVMRVTFTVEGDTISAVKALSGPAPYRSLVRKALNQVKCQTASSSSQMYMIELAFNVT